MSNPDDRKTLEMLLRSLNELVAASAAVQRVCDAWLDSTEYEDDLELN